MGNGAILGQTGANRQLSNLSDTQKALNNIGASGRSNLLINPFFTVNQRGETTYTLSSSAYTVDCWKATGAFSSAAVSYTDNYLLIYNGGGRLGISQYIENYQALSGQTVTLSFLADITSGNYKVTLDDGTSHSSSIFSVGGIKLYSFSYEISSSPSRLRCAFESVTRGQAKIYAAKLEVGSNQTLAYQDGNGDWQLLEQPDPNEILKCYRYQFVPWVGDNSFPMGFGFAFGSTSARIMIPCPVEMRLESPSIAFLGGSSLSGLSIFNNGTAKTPTEIANIKSTPTGIGVNFTTSGLIQNEICILRRTDGKPIFDANL